jgi:hypothetical protein
MNLDNLHRAFARMGARVKFGPGQLDVRRDGDGEFFLLNLEQARADAYDAGDVQPQRRHLVLLDRGGEKAQRYLCGHDERHWFVAGVPAGAATVQRALDALQPQPVRDAVLRAGLGRGRRHRRHNEAFLRQGEWFFLPRPDFLVPEDAVLRDEPLVRGRGKAHRVEFLVRFGGETVFVNDQFPDGLTSSQLAQLRKRDIEKANALPWRQMRRNPTVYARGRVRHPDHATLHLPGWHRVVVNAEVGMQNVAYLD